MKKPTIYDIKYLTKESLPYYFSRDTLKCFNQTLKDFYVHPLHNTLNQDYSYD